MKVITQQAVIEAVREHIKNRHPGGAVLEVEPHGIRQDQDWWYVPIRPSVQPARRYEYYEALAEAEHELLKSEQLIVLLVPMAADAELTAVQLKNKSWKLL